MDAIFAFFSYPQVKEALLAISTQSLAFILFLWVMAKFFWKPVLRVLNERRERIKSKFDQFDELEKQNQEFKRQYEKKLKDVDSVINLRIQEGIDHGKKLSEEMIKHARQESEKIIERGKAHLLMEVKKARSELRNNLNLIVIKTSEKFLKSKIDENKDREIISSIIDEMDRNL